MGYEWGNNQIKRHRWRKTNEILWNQRLGLEPTDEQVNVEWTFGQADEAKHHEGWRAGGN